MPEVNERQRELGTLSDRREPICVLFVVVEAI
jgi:hypothetical protein